MNLAGALRKFLEDCELEQGHSPRTLRNYEHYLERFLGFARERSIETPQAVTLEMIREWRLHLNRQGMKANTLNYHLIAVRSFLKYLAKHDIKTLAAEKIELA